MLDPTKRNIVTATSALAFRVLIRNNTHSRHHAELTLAINRLPQMRPLVVQQLIVVGPNQTKAFTFGNLGPLQYAQTTLLDIEVSYGLTGVNGSHEAYPVIFALP